MKEVNRPCDGGDDVDIHVDDVDIDDDDDDGVLDKNDDNSNVDDDNDDPRLFSFDAINFLNG